jgi:ribosome biogenesis GTPase / thiamine phosphate phosphatase
MNTLNSYGWASFQNENTYIANTDLPIGRVISIKGFKYFIITEKGELETELSGKLLYATTSEELPKVGDWVHYIDYDTLGYIVEVLPRKNELSRKNPGTKTEKQVLASNIDFAIVVQGLDRDFNLMRLERYLVQLATCGINNIVVLNKADLVDDTEAYSDHVKRLNRDVPVLFCSTYTGAGIDELKSTLLPGKTYIVIGSSGVGKSSLLNALSFETLQKTSSTSDANKKGKHTTTTRDLFKLPNGSLLIDTPGMREFGLTAGDGNDMEVMFPAIEKFASHCRYSDCTHLQDEGCAVIAAVQSGNLDEDVYESFLKLVKEQSRFSIKAEDKKRLGKQFGKMTREANNYRKKYKI